MQVKDQDTFVVVHLRRSSRQKFVFVFDRDSYHLLGRQLAAFANDPELEFDWTDATSLAIRAAELLRQ